eukprot:GHVS01014976.1.p1 GENE.GHVS01014976.1~~GHVS01014976.1.p1  ORF type:complete len:714 (+),score=127.07 GHVS01014976.1:160-2301(+)
MDYSSSGVMLVAVLLFVLPLCSHTWVLPGSFPNEYEEGDNVELRVNKIVSAQTQLPFSFYDLPYCRPDEIKEANENLGQIMMGDRTENSDFLIKMRRNSVCSVLCDFRPLSPADKAKFSDFINDGYFINWTVDNLPVTTKLKIGGGVGGGESLTISTATSEESDVTTHIAGFPVGWASPDGKHHYLYNHASLRLFYNRLVQGNYRIVGFEVEPKSLEHSLKYSQKNKDKVESVECPVGSSSAAAEGLLEGMAASTAATSSVPFRPLEIEGSSGFAFTYDVSWHASNIRWASRWDSLLQVKHTEIHWYSIINCLLTVLCLSAMVGIILLRTLMKDIARYNRLDDLEEADEESGWKLVHGDVFRRPKLHKLMCILVGSGVQILSMSFITLVLATVGVITPARRGLLLQMLLVLFAASGWFAGYAATKLNRLFDGVTSMAIITPIINDTTPMNSNHNDKQVKDDEAEVGAIVHLYPPRSRLVTVGTALLFPAVTFAIFFSLNVMIWSKGSSGAVPTLSMLLLLCMWFGLSLPLVIYGAYAGHSGPPISIPVRVNQIPRQIPKSCSRERVLLHPLLLSFFGGLLPFGAVYGEMLFMLSSMWQHQYYYLFGFLFIVLVLLIITCAETSITFTYFNLVRENHHWWWPAFFSSAFSGVYVFLYSLTYCLASLHITQFASLLLYVGYMFVFSYSFGLLSGAVGFLCSLRFVRAIYASIKVD